VELTTVGIALGVLEQATLGEGEVVIDPGELLVCYTDGVTEAVNAADEPFGVPRLIEVVDAQRERAAGEVLQAITDALLAFTEGKPPFDDVTLVVIKRTENQATTQHE
jgi:serine phosphatase RsbU (regulator of sigma subunit)